MILTIAIAYVHTKVCPYTSYPQITQYQPKTSQIEVYVHLVRINIGCYRVPGAQRSLAAGG
jgi:hypothetical protein